MRRQDRCIGRGLPLDRTARRDTLLLRRELRWTDATMLALGAIGHALADADGTVIEASPCRG